MHHKDPSDIVHTLREGLGVEITQPMTDKDSNLARNAPSEWQVQSISAPVQGPGTDRAPLALLGAKIGTLVRMPWLWLVTSTLFLPSVSAEDTSRLTSSVLFDAGPLLALLGFGYGAYRMRGYLASISAMPLNMQIQKLLDTEWLQDRQWTLACCILTAALFIAHGASSVVPWLLAYVLVMAGAIICCGLMVFSRLATYLLRELDQY